MRKKVWGITAAVLMAALFTIALVYAGEGKKVTYQGWVVDQRCNIKGTGADGSDLVNNPQDHTVGCALMPPCIASGFGIYVDKGNGSFDFYKLDKKGSDLALDVLKNTSKKDHIRLEVTGTLTGDTIKENRLEEI